MNMVIKLAAVNGKPCVKISDELTKVYPHRLPMYFILNALQNTGDPQAVKEVKEMYNLPM